MVRKGEILSQAMSGVSDELLDGARELFEKSGEETAQARQLYEVKRQTAKRKMIYAISAMAAAACIFIVLGTGITLMSLRQHTPKIYYDGVLLDGGGMAVDAQLDSEPYVVSYSLERSVSNEKSEFALHIRARGSFIIEASGGEFVENGGNVMPASDEADIVWAVEPYEGAHITVSAGTHSVKVELHLDEETGQWLLRTAQGVN